MKPQILKDRIAHFLQRATEIHNGKFDYSKVEYITAKVKVKIICPIHGEFLQTPDKHLAPKSKGCQNCWKDIKCINNNNRKGKPSLHPKPRITNEILLQRCTDKYGDRFQYDFSNYQGMRIKTIKVTCPCHGEFLTSMASFLNKTTSTGCYKCGREQLKKKVTQSYDDVIQQFNEKFNFEYDYPESNREIYINKKSIIDIICKNHGPFKKKAQKHLIGQGCFHCRVDEMIRDNILVGGYSEDLFKNKPELKEYPAFLYYLSVNNGQYYKIGISRVSINNRIRNIEGKAKRNGENINIELVKSWGDSLYNSFLREQEILNKFNYCRIFTSWSTELFSQNVLNY